MNLAQKKIIKKHKNKQKFDTKRNTTFIYHATMSHAQTRHNRNYLFRSSLLFISDYFSLTAFSIFRWHVSQNEDDLEHAKKNKVIWFQPLKTKTKTILEELLLRHNSRPIIRTDNCKVSSIFI